MNRPSRRARPALLLGLALLLYLPMLGQRDIVTSHEARVAQVARQMARTWPWQGATLDVPEVTLKDIGHGVLRLAPADDGKTVRVNPWLVPVLSGQVRLQKPPLPYWCAAVLLRIFSHGDIGEGWARLVPALLGAFSVLLVFGLARMLMGPSTAWIAGLVWLGTYFLLDEHRKAMADPFLAFFTLLCVWAWVRGTGVGTWASREAGMWEWDGGRTSELQDAAHSSTEARPHIPTSPRPHLSPTLLIFYLSLALGVLAKGPMIVLHVAVALVLFHFCYRRRIPGRIVLHAMGIALFLLVAAPWFVYALLNVPHAMQIWWYESAGEITADNMENAREWWYYAPNLLVIAVPWVVPWVVGMVSPLAHLAIVSRAGRASRSSGAQFRRPLRRAFAPLWFIAIVVFFSLVQQKKIAYLLPVMAAQTLLIAQGIMGLRPLRRGLMHGAVVVAKVQAVIGLVFAGVLIVLIVLTPSPARWTGAVIAIAGLAIAAAATYAIVRRQGTRWVVLQSAAYSVLAVALLAFYLGPLDNHRSAKPVARQIRALLQSGGYTIPVERVPEEVAVYLPLGLRYEPRTHVLAVLDDSHGVRLRRKQHATPPVPPPTAFRSWASDAQVLEVRPLDVPGIPGDSRWKLYDLTVERRALVSAD